MQTFSYRTMLFMSFRNEEDLLICLITLNFYILYLLSIKNGKRNLLGSDTNRVMLSVFLDLRQAS